MLRAKKADVVVRGCSVADLVYRVVVAWCGCNDRVYGWVVTTFLVVDSVFDLGERGDRTC